MRRRIVGIAAVLVAAASVGRGQNLVADGSFASNLDAWHHDLVEGGTSAWVVHTLTRTYAENSFQQTSAADFAGVSLEDGQSLKITAEPHFLIVYGATVDNVTNDPSAQFLTHYRVLQP